jgi:hypothetical protein
VSNCNPIHLDRKSIVENSTHRPIQLTPAEKARRVAELRARIHTPAFQGQLRMSATEHGRDLP